MSIQPSGPLIVLLGIVLLACIIMGLQVRGLSQGSMCWLARSAVTTQFLHVLAACVHLGASIERHAAGSSAYRLAAMSAQDRIASVDAVLAAALPCLQVRFFLHAPLQLASVLFAAMSTPEICGAFFESTPNIRCVGVISALQLSLGLLLPSICVYFLEGRSSRAFLPHMQAKRWLVNSV